MNDQQCWIRCLEPGRRLQNGVCTEFLANRLDVPWPVLEAACYAYRYGDLAEYAGCQKGLFHCNFRKLREHYDEHHLSNGSADLHEDRQWGCSGLLSSQVQGIVEQLRPVMAAGSRCTACEVRIIKCENQDHPAFGTGLWMDDSLLGGPESLQSRDQCQARQAFWTSRCGPTAGVESRFIDVCTRTDEIVSRIMQMQRFTVVVTANLQGGAAQFLNSVLPSDGVLLIRPVLPMTRSVYEPLPEAMLSLMIGRRSIGTVSSTGLLEILKAVDGQWHKVFFNHIIGIPLSLLEGLFTLPRKRFISITHDFTWVLKSPQPTFRQLRTPGGADRNYVLKPFLKSLEMKSQHPATAEVFEQSGAGFRSIHVVPMPDYSEAAGRPRRASAELKVGCIGAISKIKGADLLVQLSQHVPVFVFGAIDLSSTPSDDAGRLRHQGPCSGGRGPVTCLATSRSPGANPVSVVSGRAPLPPLWRRRKVHGPDPNPTFSDAHRRVHDHLRAQPPPLAGAAQRLGDRSAVAGDLLVHADPVNAHWPAHHRALRRGHVREVPRDCPRKVLQQRLLSQLQVDGVRGEAGERRQG